MVEASVLYFLPDVCTQAHDILACLCVWLVVVGSMSGPNSPLCGFKTAAKWDVEALKQITRTLLSESAVDVLASGLKIFMPVSWSPFLSFCHIVFDNEKLWRIRRKTRAHLPPPELNYLLLLLLLLCKSYQGTRIIMQENTKKEKKTTKNTEKKHFIVEECRILQC